MIYACLVGSSTRPERGLIPCDREHAVKWLRRHRLETARLPVPNHWLKIKNPAAPAVKRKAEEDWANNRWGRRRRTRSTAESE